MNLIIFAAHFKEHCKRTDTSDPLVLKRLSLAENIDNVCHLKLLMHDYCFVCIVCDLKHLPVGG